MIIIKDRELLIPNNERYIGTTYDTNSENRVFRLARYNQAGVDLAGLTFSITLFYNGTVLDEALLAKTYDDDYITLTWTITAVQVSKRGTIFAGISGNDTNDTVKWSSFQGAFYTETSLANDAESEHERIRAMIAEEVETRTAKDAEETAAITALQTSMTSANTAISGLQTDQDVLEARMDEFASLPDGSTAGDAELLDIRVGADGTTYSSAGNAVRGQVTDLKSHVSDIYTDGYTPTGDTQIFDSMHPTVINADILTTTLAITSFAARRCVCIARTIADGDSFSFNYCGEETYSDLGISGIHIFLTNSITIGQTALKNGETNYSTMRGKITASSSAQYVCIAFQFSSSAVASANIDEVLKHLVVRTGTDYSTDYVDYYTWNNMKISEWDEEYPDLVKLIPTKAVPIGNDIISTATISPLTGWTDNGDGSYTHATGSTSALRILLNSLAASTGYLVVYTVTNNAEGKLNVRLGTGTTPVDGYNGLTTMAVGFISDADVVTTANKYLDFIPASSYSGTVSDIHVYKVVPGSATTYNLPFFDNIETDRDDNISGFWNVVLSPEGLQKTPNGTRNVVIGKNALKELLAGNRNVAVGTFAMAALLDGERNVAVGADALYLATHATDCVAVGKNSMVNGGSALADNVAVGNNAMGNNPVDATRNVGVGRMALQYGKNRNTAVGYKAGYYSNGDGNTSVGYNANESNYINGDYNTAVGYGAGVKSDTASAENIETISNAIAIGYLAKATASGQMVLGGDSITEVIMCGNKRIVFNQDGTVTWETVS